VRAAAVPALVALGSVLAAAPLSATEWRTYAGGPRRLFFNPAETTITADVLCHRQGGSA
jgi:hypothetical protein